MTILTVAELSENAKAPAVWNKASLSGGTASTFRSLWKATGIPAAGASPPVYTAGSGYACSNATLGAAEIPQPTAGQDSLLARWVWWNSSNLPLALVLYDRLWTCSGLSSNTTDLQSITTPGALPSRDALEGTDGFGVELWGEVYTAPGAGAATWTVTYTNTAGTGSRSATYAHAAAAEAVGQMLPFQLASGDFGVKSVESFQASGTSGTAGDIGLTLLRRIATIACNTYLAIPELNAWDLGLIPVPSGACLAGMVYAEGTTTRTESSFLTLSQG